MYISADADKEVQRFRAIVVSADLGEEMRSPAMVLWGYL